jgi:hypothetical protein
VGGGGESGENSICALTGIWSATIRCTIGSMGSTMILAAIGVVTGDVAISAACRAAHTTMRGAGHLLRS